MTDIEDFAVRSYDALQGERITEKPTLAMAQDYRDYLRRIGATRGTYSIRAEVVARMTPGGDWQVLTDDDITRMQDEAWAGLDEAFTPVIAAGLDQKGQG